MDILIVINDYKEGLFLAAEEADIVNIIREDIESDRFFVAEQGAGVYLVTAVLEGDFLNYVNFRKVQNFNTVMYKLLKGYSLQEFIDKEKNRNKMLRRVI